MIYLQTFISNEKIPISIFANVNSQLLKIFMNNKISFEE